MTSTSPSKKAFPGDPRSGENPNPTRNFFSFGVTENDLKLRFLFHRTYRKAKNPDPVSGNTGC
ncbi:hypothetical protein CH367_02600 [Leptospira barantonii]|uniref:Uncharacterized protein n=1 Tax=Leptospira barantonii TaxID=2023184 RepID=A0ABX4NQ41_9LEPT|nr:hypothetical protein CH367_02600 [Leptospira barantonii]